MLSNANVGDRVFCVPKCDDVILLEKNADFSGRYRCRTFEGEELLVFPDDLNPIFKGDATLIYRIKHVEDMFEFKARKYGFRIEKEFSTDDVIYIIFGNTQDQIKDFISTLIRDNETKKK